ncbi:2-keto-4-pentenoate hydratase [Bradyrhizobium sp. USDA 328]
MPASCSEDGRSARWTRTCAGSARSVSRTRQLEETGLAAGVLNHPATAVAWLANKIAPRGLALEPGQVVLAGSFIRPIETRKGDTIQADYGAYGSVSCYFA